MVQQGRHVIPLYSLLLGASLVFFFNDTATTEIYTLSLHDALPIYGAGAGAGSARTRGCGRRCRRGRGPSDRKSTRLNSSHITISYAVFCLKKKKKNHHMQREHIRIIHNIRSIIRGSSDQPTPPSAQ